MSDIKKCRAWQKARALNKRIYAMVEKYPRWERYGLVVQTTKSSTAVPALIAEGLGREYPAEIERYSRYAMGEAKELESHLIMANDVEYISDPHFASLDSDLQDVQRAIRLLIRKVQK